MKEYLKTKNGILYHGDCLDVMPYLAKKNIKFDLILTDPPYGITACKWDSVIDLDKMWFNINNVINDNTAICLFGTEPFSSTLRLSNKKCFKYDWIWVKNRPTNFLLSNKMPMRNNEIISMFYSKQVTFNKILEKRVQNDDSKKRLEYRLCGATTFGVYGTTKRVKNKYDTDLRNPTTTKYFDCIKNNNKYHPTQKPVDLYKYLIKTYTKENDLILDFCAGSGTLAMACHDLNRRFIMIEKEIKYCEVIKKRLIDNNIKILNNKIKLRKRV